jgi:hypothetical protein
MRRMLCINIFDALGYNKVSEAVALLWMLLYKYLQPLKRRSAFG